MPPGSGPVSLIRGREPAEQQHRARSAHHHWHGGRFGLCGYTTPKKAPLARDAATTKGLGGLRICLAVWSKFPTRLTGSDGRPPRFSRLQSCRNDGVPPTTPSHWPIIGQSFVGGSWDESVKS